MHCCNLPNRNSDFLDPARRAVLARMRFDGDGVAVCIIKIDSQLKCTGILDSPGRWRMQRDLTGNRHVDGYVDK